MNQENRLTSLEGSDTTGAVERIVPGTPEWEFYYPDHIQRYQFVTKRMPPGARVLDAGCGCGYGATYLVDHGTPSIVVAVDIAAEALNVARQHFHREQIVWLRDDCHTLEAAAQYVPFDVVCNLDNIEHLKEPERFLLRVTEQIKPDGILITSTPNRLVANKLRGVAPDTAPQNPYHYREYTSDEFNALLRGYFEEVTMWYQCRSPAALLRQSFEPALNALWSNPAVRLGRWLQRVIRRRQVPRSLDELLPSLRQWEILEDDPGDDVTWAFIAVCHQPKDLLQCCIKQ